MNRPSPPSPAPVGVPRRCGGKRLCWATGAGRIAAATLAALMEAGGPVILVTEPRHVAWINDDSTYRLEKVDGRGHVYKLSRESAATSPGPADHAPA